MGDPRSTTVRLTELDEEDRPRVTGHDARGTPLYNVLLATSGHYIPITGHLMTPPVRVDSPAIVVHGELLMRLDLRSVAWLLDIAQRSARFAVETWLRTDDDGRSPMWHHGVARSLSVHDLFVGIADSEPPTGATPWRPATLPSP